MNCLHSFHLDKNGMRAGGVFKEEISSKTWIDNINKDLDKCKTEIDKCKQKIFGNIVEGFAWAGLGIAAGIYSGSPFNPAIIAAIPL